MRRQPIQGGRAGATEEESTSTQDAGSQAKAANSRKADSVRFMCYLGLVARAGRQPNPPQREPTACTSRGSTALRRRNALGHTHTQAHLPKDNLSIAPMAQAAARTGRAGATE